MKPLAGKHNALELFVPLSHDSFAGAIDKLCALSSHREALQDNSHVLSQQELEPQKTPILAAYTRCQQMPITNVYLGCHRMPAVSELASLLKESGMSKTLSHGKLLHCIIISYGLLHSIFLANCLIQMYGHCGCLLDAQSVFDHVHHRNVFSWNILITAYAQNQCFQGAKSLFDSMPFRDVVSWNAIITASTQNGQSKVALALFTQMIAQGVPLSSTTFVSAIDACANMCMLEGGQLVYAVIVQEKCEQECIVGTALIAMYSKCGMMECAWGVFRRMGGHNNVSWTAMVGALARNAQPREALCVFKRMQLGGFAPNNVSFVCAISACTTLGQLEQGLEIHAAIVNSGVDQDIAVATSLINMYGKCGSLESAVSIFLNMTHFNVMSWNAILSASNDSGNFKKALLFFCDLQLGDVRPDSITFVSSLEACANLALLQEGRILHAMIVEDSFEQDIVVGNALIDMYGKCSNPQDARGIFSKMDHQDAIAWTSLIAGYSQIRCDLAALDLFQQMHIEGIKPDQVSFVCAINSCSSLTAFCEGQRIHIEVINSGYASDTVVGNALIHLYGRCGCVTSALDVFSKMPRRNVVSWTAMLAAYASNGFAMDAVNLFSSMSCEGIKPNEITFINALTAFSHTGHFNDGWHLFSAIITNNSIAHTRDHFVCMIDLLGRAGLLEEARHLINSAPFENIGVAWLSLLGACKLHGDMQHGMLAANQCLQLEPQNSAPYMLLSNMYE